MGTEAYFGVLSLFHNTAGDIYVSQISGHEFTIGKPDQVLSNHSHKGFKIYIFNCQIRTGSGQRFGEFWHAHLILFMGSVEPQALCCENDTK